LKWMIADSGSVITDVIRLMRFGMESETELLDPCPSCGNHLLTTPFNHIRGLVVDEIRNAGGLCSECKQPILVTPSEALRVRALTPPQESSETTRLATLQLAVRSRTDLKKLNIETVGDLAQHPKTQIQSLLSAYPGDMIALEELVSEIGLSWS